MLDYLKCICKQDQIQREFDFETDNLTACFLSSKHKHFSVEKYVFFVLLKILLG